MERFRTSTAPERRNRVRARVAALAAALVAMAALPVALAGPAAAQAAPPPASPEQCVPGLLDQFDGLKHHGEALGFHLGDGAKDASNARHYQGIARVPGPGVPAFAITSNGNPNGVTDFTWQRGELSLAQMPSREQTGERLRSNRLSPTRATDQTAPPTEDRITRALAFNGEHWPAYRHLGGIQMWGDVAVVGMDEPVDKDNQRPGQIMLVDFADRDNPVSRGLFGLDHGAGWVALAATDHDTLMLLISASGGEDLYAYELSSDNLRSEGLTLERRGHWTAEEIGPNWITGYDSMQAANLYRDCTTGELFLLGVRDDGPLPVPVPSLGTDYASVWSIADDFKPSFVAEREMVCNSQRNLQCHFAAAGGYHVSPAGDLILYASEFDNDGPSKSVRMAEFRNVDGHRPGSAARLPVAEAGGPYSGTVGQPMTLDASASRPPVAQAWAELYDDKGFGDRSVTFDWPDAGSESWADLRDHDGFNDKPSSVRWAIPEGCRLVLHEDRGYRGATRVLEGTGRVESNADLGSFSDKTSSVHMAGSTCDGRAMTFAWDLDGDGSFESPGAQVVHRPRVAGTTQVRLQVCGGFAGCSTDVATVQTPPVSLPAPTVEATLDGTAGDAGWYRSAVDVNVAATPATNARLTVWATGADAQPGRVVEGATATVLVDVDDETVVHARADGPGGVGPERSVTVKVDTVAPTLVVTGPPAGIVVPVDHVLPVAARCTDTRSGVKSCPDGQPLATGTVGTFTTQVTASDLAGNTATATLTYGVAPVTAEHDLVFVGVDPSDRGALQRSRPDGSGVVTLVPSSARVEQPVWSADGTRIAYGTGSGTISADIAVIPADGGTPTVLAATPAVEEGPAWSPDGTRIAYVARDDSGSRLMVVPSTGGPASVVVTHPDRGGLNDPTWSADGASIYTGARGRLWKVPASGLPAGTPPEQILSSDGTARVMNPSWAADGRLLLQMSEFETGTDLFIWTPQSVTNLTADDNEPSDLNRTVMPNELAPRWTPDGRVLFDLDGNLYVMQPQRLAPAEVQVDLPYVVRDGHLRP